MYISARNMLRGSVKTVNHGAVTSEVTIALPNGIEIVSIITKDSAERLGLSQGKEVYAVIKASDVMLLLTKRVSAIAWRFFPLTG
jgi:molybdopterin-binding protein